MKRRVTAFTIMLIAVLLMRLALPALADVMSLTGEGYDVALGYCEGYDQPVSATATKEITMEGDWKDREFPFTTPYGEDGTQSARAVVTLASSRALTDDEWQSLSAWLGNVLSGAVPNARATSAGDMAEQMARATERGLRGDDVAWNDGSVQLKRVKVEAPYYPTLTRGDRSEDVKRLQQKLIDMGYLEGKADGQFGGMTEAAVKEVETELRAMEQAAIDAMAPTSGDAEQTPESEQTPEPEQTPKTQVDGVVDLALQIRLNSDEFPRVDCTLDKGADASAVTRLQRRLIALGMLTGAADGDYGGNTRRAVRIFQHYNGLEETGLADEATQRAVFSASAQAPENPLMTVGSEGDAVKQLQNRLIQLGFMTGTADGSYGNGTKVAIERLQTYMRAREIEALTRAAEREAQQSPVAEDGAVQALAAPMAEQPAITVTPTIEVNGVADPLLLDAFYASDFPAVPDTMKNGDENLDVQRLQRRLNQLEYMYYGLDGSYGNGTESAVRDFQKRSGLPEDGIAGAQTLEKLFSTGAPKALKPYVLKISIDKQRVYAYGLDENNEHTVLVRTMKASTGLSATPTPRGTFQASTGPGARWHYFKKFSCWAQYAYYIEGDIMIHSVLYGSKGGAVTSSSVRNLGRRASHGCVRLSVEDAKWVWNNCPTNTKIVVY